jgi:hypothetical protein
MVLRRREAWDGRLRSWIRRRSGVLWFANRAASQMIDPVRLARSSSYFVRTFTAKIAVQGRYKLSPYLRVLSRSLQGIAERPLPCNYNVIQ